MEVAGSQKPPIKGLDPSQLFAILAKDQPVEIWLAQAQNELADHDHADYHENQGRVAGQSQDQLDARDDQHDNDHQDAEDRRAQEVMKQVMADDAIRGEYPVIGYRVGHQDQHGTYQHAGQHRQ